MVALRDGCIMKVGATCSVYAEPRRLARSDLARNLSIFAALRAPRGRRWSRRGFAELLLEELGRDVHQVFVGEQADEVAVLDHRHAAVAMLAHELHGVDRAGLDAD